MINLLKTLLISFCVTVICFVIVSGLVAGITVFFPKFLRFWPLAFTYSIGGIIAAALSLEYSFTISSGKSESIKYLVIIFQVLAGVICFFFVSTLIANKWFEMRGLEIVFRAFGAALAMGSLLFIGKKIR